MPRTPDVVELLAAAEAEAEAEAKRKLALQEEKAAKRRKREEAEQAAADEREARLRLNHPDLVTATHGALAAELKEWLVPNAEEQAAAGYVTISVFASRLSLLDHEFSRWLNHGGADAAQMLPYSTLLDLDGVVRRWLTAPRRDPTRRLSEAAVATHAQLVSLVTDEHLVLLQQTGRYAGLLSRGQMAAQLGFSANRGDLVSNWISGRPGALVDETVRLWLSDSRDVL